MREFSIHHRSTSAAPPGFVPKGGDLVSAKFSDGAWYRAKIRRSSPLKKEAEVTFIDYGNQDTVAFSNIRPLDPKFRSLPGQAHEARLRQISLFFSCYLVSAKHFFWIHSALSNSPILPVTIILRQLIVSEHFAKVASSLPTLITKNGRCFIFVLLTLQIP
jgi:hypothetical protein